MRVQKPDLQELLCLELGAPVCVHRLTRVGLSPVGLAPRVHLVCADVHEQGVAIMGAGVQLQCLHQHCWNVDGPASS